MPGVSVHHQASRERPVSGHGQVRESVENGGGLPARNALALRRVVIFFGRVLYKSIIRGTRRCCRSNLLIPFRAFVKTREISDFSHRETF
jgi:hypothetical protein